MLKLPVGALDDFFSLFMWFVRSLGGAFFSCFTCGLVGFVDWPSCERLECA